MTKWDIVLVIIALTALAASVGAPVLKLNTSITKLVTRLDHLADKFDCETMRNQESHGRIYGRLDRHDVELGNHSLKIRLIEKEIENEKYENQLDSTNQK